MRTTLNCSHCDNSFHWKQYAKHVKACIEKKIDTWDEAAHSQAYYKQVRVLSRYAQPGDPRRRQHRRKSWGWWAVVKADGPVLTPAERAH